MRIIFTVLMLLAFQNTWGQNNATYPDVFSTYFYNMSLINPSYVPARGSVELKSYYKFRTGIYSDISTFSASGEKTWRKESGPSHTGRLILFNEKEGPYISNPKAFMNYAIRIPLEAGTDIMGGISLGLSRINYSAPSGAGDVNLVDGGLGLGLRFKKTEMGFSSLQTFNSEGTVINSFIRLQRFYNLHLSGQKKVNSVLDVKGYLLWRMLKFIPDQYHMGLSLLYLEMIEVGTLYKLSRGLSYFGSFIVNSSKNDLLLSITYNSNFLNRSSVPGNSVEIGLSYRIN